MTVLEHLKIFSKLKGIKGKVEEIIDQTIIFLSLEKFRNVKSQFLSGGNKRKLQLAIAILGNPRVIILDEPSSGMDPET